MKQTTGKKYDLEITALMEAEIKKALKEKTGLSAALDGCYQQFETFAGQNKHYKKTPKVFISPSIFFVQAHNAIQSSLDGIINSETILLKIYNWMVLKSPAISTAPDVNWNEATRILKAQNLFITPQKN